MIMFTKRSNQDILVCLRNHLISSHYSSLKMLNNSQYSISYHKQPPKIQKHNFFIIAGIIREFTQRQEYDYDYVNGHIKLQTQHYFTGELS